MIINVDIKQLESIVLELSSLIDEYEEVELNVFNQLKDSCINWNDGNSLLFEESIKNEKDDSFSFLYVLQNNRNIIDFIISEYKKIGNKIMFNLDKKNVIINTINDCITKSEELLNAFDKVDKSFYYYEIKLINDEKERVSSVNESLKEIKDRIEDLYKEVMSIEEMISTKILKLDDIKLKKYSFSFN